MQEKKLGIFTIMVTRFVTNYIEKWGCLNDSMSFPQPQTDLIGWLSHHFFFLFPLLNVLAPVAIIIEKIMNSVNVLPVFWIFQSVVKHRNVWSKNSENLSLRINLGLKYRLSFVSKVPCITQMQIEGFFWSLICLRRFKFL